MKKQNKSQLPFTDVRQNLTAILDDVEKSGRPVTILRRGKPAAVIIPHDMYEQQIARTKPFRLAGSFKAAEGVDVEATLAEAKQQRIAMAEKRMKRLKAETK